MSRSLLLASLAATTMLVHPAFAQVAFELDEIIVSGNLDETTLERIGVTASVVTRETLEQTAEVRAIDFLARLPGIDVRGRGAVGGLSSITIRGAGQNYVRVLVDGIDVSDPSGPQMAYDFGSLRTADIDRIEVLRGGQSALYGSESIGGVINITTRRAIEEGTAQFLTLEAGSYGTVNASYGITNRVGAFDYALTASTIKTDGFSAADENDGNTEADGYDAKRLSFAAGYDLANGARVGLNGFVEDSTAEFDEQFPLVDGTTDEYTDNRVQGLRAYAEFQTGAVANEIALTYYNINRKSFGSTVWGTANVVYDGERVGASYLGQMALSNAVDLRFGADHTIESYDQSGDYGLSSGEYDMTGVFAELAYETAGLDLVGTVRHDEHSEYGGFTTGRVAVNWRPAQDWTVRASAASSFRAPSLYELYGPYGDPAMVPEESRSVDLGIERRFGPDNFIRATAFYSETDNLIDFPFPYANVPGTVTRQGVELEAGIALSEAWRMDASYTYVEGTNPVLTAGNAWNLEFPEHDLSLTLTGDLSDRLSAAFTVQHAAGRQVLADYTVANTTISYDVTDGIEAYLRVENLFDEEYQLTSGYGTSDRAIYAGIRAEF
ncbi:MAG: TonB-dependent receptor [Yoonia sp.]|nr:TonB-dependent receptor [Yoonia sp.]